MIVSRSESAYYKFERVSLEFTTDENDDLEILYTDAEGRQQRMTLHNMEAVELASFLHRNL